MGEGRPFAREGSLPLSLKANERAAFHDATLRELALLIERQTGVQTAGVPPSGGNGGNHRLKAELQRARSQAARAARNAALLAKAGNPISIQSLRGRSA